MHIQIGRPYAVSEKGRRPNNEDSIYPEGEVVRVNQRLFLVCDGVGGAEKGEVASALACDLIPAYFLSMLGGQGKPTEAFIQKAVHYAEAHFDSYIKQHPEASGMATTLTLLYFGEEGAWAAHIGDSRIYQFREGKIIFRTEDHSLVNLWLQAGRITPEEATQHPKRNIILRAIQGRAHPAEAEVTQLEDLQAGDCFFLCTDGVLESFSDQALEALFKPGNSPESIKDRIVEACDRQSRDNYSFYIIPVQQVQTGGKTGQNLLSFLYSFI
ncbi:MAG: protein phosphatase 2C domain-containing protein [Tannerella sp.]|nr:protein phosphatase 2C domain-containing protein [Tannerella sp.]